MRLDVLSLVGNIIGIGLVVVGVVRVAVELYVAYRNRHRADTAAADVPLSSIDARLDSINRAEPAVFEDGPSTETSASHDNKAFSLVGRPQQGALATRWPSTSV